MEKYTPFAVYVDDIILAGKNQERIKKFIKMIGERFDIRDIGNLSTLNILVKGRFG